MQRLLSTITITSSLRFIVATSRLTVSATRSQVSLFSSKNSFLRIRGGDGDGVGGSTSQSLSTPNNPSRDFSSSTPVGTPPSVEGGKKFVTLADPAPGSPFHYAFPVHSLDAAKEFYGNVLNCEEGRSSEKWQDYSLHGHQIVCHWVGNDYRCVDYYNPVDGDEVPVPHAGLALTVNEFHALADRVRKAGVKFIIEPHLRFQGAPGEQWTMFFKDPRYVDLYEYELESVT
jgi:extradiol dioxygenase family protein